jgi:8-oxo-dGTP pyrophosphatase MutT (NUDIX family)
MRIAMADRDGDGTLPQTTAADRTERRAGITRDRSVPNRRPRDAATLILIDRSGSVPKVLLGRRHASHAFMPGRFVFPGGGIEKFDRLMPSASELDPNDIARLMQGVAQPSAAKARALALAAIRETYEETGLMLGVARADAPSAPGGAWDAFAAARVHPDLSAIHFIARALTPPRRPRRFDARFFAADAESIAHRVDGFVGPDKEFVELAWVPIAEARRLNMAGITAVVLEELQDRSAAGMAHTLPVPHYRMLQKRFVRELL